MSTSRLQHLHDLLEGEPDDPFLLYAIAYEYAKHGDGDNAVTYYDSCITVDPGFTYAYYHKAVALRSSGRIDVAVETIEAGLAVATEAGERKAASELRALLSNIRRNGRPASATGRARTSGSRRGRLSGV